MSHTIELIERFKATKGIESDYAAAKALGLNPNRISNYRCGVSHADDRMAVVLADELGLDRLETIARINADRAKDSASRAFWKRVAKQVASAAALVLLVGAAGIPSPAAAIERSGLAATVYYVNSKTTQSSDTAALGRLMSPAGCPPDSALRRRLNSPNLSLSY